MKCDGGGSVLRNVNFTIFDRIILNLVAGVLEGHHVYCIVLHKVIFTCKNNARQNTLSVSIFFATLNFRLFF